MANEVLDYSDTIPAQPGWYVIELNEDNSKSASRSTSIIAWVVHYGLDKDNHVEDTHATPVTPLWLNSKTSKYVIKSPEGHYYVPSDPDNTYDDIHDVLEFLRNPNS